MSPDAKDVIKTARQLAKPNGQVHLCHLLWAVIEQNRSVAIALRQFNLTTDSIRQYTAARIPHKKGLLMPVTFDQAVMTVVAGTIPEQNGDSVTSLDIVQSVFNYTGERDCSELLAELHQNIADIRTTLQNL